MDVTGQASETLDRDPRPSSDASSPQAESRKPLRVWLPICVLVIYWIVTWSSYYVEMAMFYRFITRTIVLAITILFFLFWWLGNRHFRWRERLAIFALLLILMFTAPLVADPTMNAFVMAVGALPVIFTVGAVWGCLTRNRAVSAQLAGLAVIFLGVFGFFSLVRWDGLDGRQRASFSWRWTPTAEERFLASTGGVKAPVDTSAAPNAEEWKLQPEDWPSFRGGNREGAVTGVTLGDWSQVTPVEAWRRLVGPAWSSMILVDDFLFTQEQRGEREAVVCYRASDGTEVWVYEHPARFEEGLSGNGPRSTPTFAHGHLYTAGARGHLACLNAVNGNVVWSHELFAESEGQLPQWGYSVSPLVVDGLVVIFASGDVGLVAYQAESGERAWTLPSGKFSYATPQLHTLAGVRQIVMHDDRALYGVDVDSGTQLWEHKNTSQAFMAMLQPHQVGENELVVAWDTGLARLHFDQDAGKWTISERWTSNRLKPGFNDFFVHNDHIYGLDDGIFCCVKLEDGKRVWKKGRYGFGQILLLPELNELLVLTEKGELVRVATDPKEHRELGQFKAIEGKTWNHPILAKGRLYIRNSEEMACFPLQE